MGLRSLGGWDPTRTPRTSPARLCHGLGHGRGSPPQPRKSPRQLERGAQASWWVPHPRPPVAEASLTPSHAPGASSPALPRHQLQARTRLGLPPPSCCPPSLHFSVWQGARATSLRRRPRTQARGRGRCQVALCHGPSGPQTAGQQTAGQLAMFLEHGGGPGARRGPACVQKPLSWQPAQPWARQGGRPLPAKKNHEGAPSVHVRTAGRVTEPEPRCAAAPRRESGRLSQGAPGRYPRADSGYCHWWSLVCPSLGNDRPPFLCVHPARSSAPRPRHEKSSPSDCGPEASVP